MESHALPNPAPARRSAATANSLLAVYGLAVLVIATVFSALDRQIFVLLAEPMRQSLGLSDTKLGLLQGVGITLFAGAAAVPLGWLAGLGLALSGALVQGLDDLRPLLPHALQAMESWRLAFLAVAVPGPLVALAVLLIRLHPQRGGVDAPVSVDMPALRPYVQAHRRTMFCVFGGSGLAGLGVAASGSWVPIVATRIFGAPAGEVGQGVGVAYLLGTACGALLGALSVKLMSRHVGLATPIRVIAVGSGLSAVFSLLMLTTQSANGLYLLFGLQIATLIAGSVLAPTVLQDMTPAALRSRVIAIGSTVAIGLSALSPVLVGALSDVLHSQAQGLLIAMASIGAAAFALGAVVMGMAEKPFVRTVLEVNPAVAARPV
jgi:MFS family permease